MFSSTMWLKLICYLYKYRRKVKIHHSKRNDLDIIKQDKSVLAPLVNEVKDIVKASNQYDYYFGNFLEWCRFDIFSALSAYNSIEVFNVFVSVLNFIFFSISRKHCFKFFYKPFKEYVVVFAIEGARICFSKPLKKERTYFNWSNENVLRVQYVGLLQVVFYVLTSLSMTVLRL